MHRRTRTDLWLERSREPNVPLERLGGELWADCLVPEPMDVDDMLGNMEIDVLVALVEHDKEQIEPRHDGRRHGHVRPKRHLPVVPPSDRVGRGEDGRPRVESCLDAGFGDRDSLLLHCLVNGDLVRDVHLVKLVDRADPVVGEHERSGLDRELARLLVLDDSGRQTSGRGGLARGVDRSGEEAADVLEELGL